MMFDGLGSSATHIKGGRIKALMVSGNKRNPAFPDVPSAAEVGLPDYTVTTWYGLWAPKGTPADIQARVIDEVRKAVQTDELKAIWARRAPSSPTCRSSSSAASSTPRSRAGPAVVKASGAKLD
jgi:tripartite-type tricarboxylate transporter receptor subunit TctC